MINSAGKPSDVYCSSQFFGERSHLSLFASGADTLSTRSADFPVVKLTNALIDDD